VIRALDEESYLMRYLFGEHGESLNVKSLCQWKRTPFRLLSAAAYAVKNNTEFYTSPVRLLCLVILEVHDFTSSSCRVSSAKQQHPWTLSYGLNSLMCDPSVHDVCSICLDPLFVSIQTRLTSFMHLVTRAPSLAVCRSRSAAAQVGISAARCPARVAGHVATLPCGHRFHAQCAREAARHRLQCPYRRGNLESSQQVTNFDKLFWQLSSSIFFLSCSFWPGAFLHICAKMVKMLQVAMVLGTCIDAWCSHAELKSFVDVWVG